MMRRENGFVFPPLRSEAKRAWWRGRRHGEDAPPTALRAVPLPANAGREEALGDCEPLLSMHAQRTK